MSQTRHQSCCKWIHELDHVNLPCWLFMDTGSRTQLCFCTYLYEVFLLLVSVPPFLPVALSSLCFRWEDLVLWFLFQNEVIKWELTHQIFCALAFPFLADESNKNVQFCFALGSIKQSRAFYWVWAPGAHSCWHCAVKAGQCGKQERRSLPLLSPNKRVCAQLKSPTTLPYCWCASTAVHSPL